MRKLVHVACGYAAALLLAHYLLPLAWLPFVAGGAGAAGCALALLLRGEVRTRALLLLFSAAAGLLWYWAYTGLAVQPAERFVGETRSVRAVVTDYAASSDAYARVTVRSVDDTVPHVRMLIYDYGDYGLDALRPGDIVTLPLKLTSAATLYGEESDYYLSSGIHLRGYLTAAVSTERRAALHWIFFPKTVARAIREQALACFPADTAPLMKALLTGDRTEYYADETLSHAMRAAGLSHVVAISGMHVAFLISLLHLGLGRRRGGAVLGSLLLLLFAAMVGFTPSVVRAALMQFLLLLAPLVRRENDPPTSLSAALLVLLLINPIAVASLSLQLSFCAVAGLLLFTPRIYNWLCLDSRGKNRLPVGIWGRILRAVFASFSTSVGALVFTTPISALQFGYVPLYSVLTNLLCLWSVSASFCCGYFVCLLGLLWQPLGTVTGWLVGWLPRYAIFVAGHIAAWPHAQIYTTGNLGGWWLLLVYAVLGGSFLLRRGRYRPVIPLCICAATFAALTCTVRTDLAGQLRVTALDVGQGQSIVAMTEDVTVMIDCGSSDSATNAGDTAADYLLQNGRDRVDLLVLTHFHSDHVNGVTELMNRVDVARLAIAAEFADNSYSDDILAACTRCGTDIYYIAENTDFSAGTLTMTVFAPLGTGDENQESLLVYGESGSFEFLVTGDADSDVEALLTDAYALGDMELLIVGHHGSKYATGDALLDAITVETAFVSVGAHNSYGHPSAEVLERLAAHGIEVCRTDEDGTVSLTVEIEDYGEENKSETGL